MINRFVKMTFDSACIDAFKQLFDEHKKAIRNSPGCLYLELLNDIKHPHIFFTYSKWETEEDLNKYRHSATFKEVWPKTKVLFCEKAEAWSTKAMEVKA